MKAYLRSVRIAPKKANLIAKMVRGLPVPEAVEQLRLTNKKAARIIEKLLRSAIANASHNDKQDAQTMVIKTIIVNQGMAYRRGMPKARGQQRPYRKFLSHIELELGFPGEDPTVEPAKTSEKKAKKTTSIASKETSSEVKTTKPRAKKADVSESSAS